MSKYFRQHIPMNENIPSKLRGFLTKAGLSDKEIKVYVYLLSAGPQPAAQIAKVCGLIRTNAYDIVKKLEERGLTTSLGSEYGRLVKASPPAEISEILETKEQEIDALKSQLQEILPLFENLSAGSAPAGRSQVAYYNGQEGLRKLLRLSLHAEKPLIREAGSELDMIASLGKEFVAEFHERRAAKHISFQALRPGGQRAPGTVFQGDAAYLREIRVRPEGLISLKSNMLIWDSQVAFFSSRGELFGTLIANEALAVMLASWFDFIWSKSKIIR